MSLTLTVIFFWKVKDWEILHLGKNLLCSHAIFHLLCNNYRIIESIEAFAALVPLSNQSNLTVAGEIMLTRENFAVLIVEPEVGPDDFLGQIVQFQSRADTNSDIDFTQGAFVMPNSSSTDDTRSLASVSITQELFEIFQNNTPPNELPRLIFVVYDDSSPLFQDPNRNGTGSVILSFLQSPLQASAPPTNLNEPIEFQFHTIEVIINHNNVE